MKKIAGKNVVLIGFMGTGKTEVGRLLAASLHRYLVDSDRAIVERVGKPITEIFATFGEAYFRKQEKEVILDLCGQSGLVLATGGGVVLDPQNVEALQKSGFVIWLDASVTAIEQRLDGDESRPLLANIDSLRALYHERTSVYRVAAHVRVDTTDKPPLAVVEEIVKILCQQP
ncbi:MAG: shikimate kinase [Firmicutes bacterium]|nr:shikimate kinase [Bacillota bacterium]